MDEKMNEKFEWWMSQMQFFFAHAHDAAIQGSNCDKRIAENILMQLRCLVTETRLCFSNETCTQAIELADAHIGISYN